MSSEAGTHHISRSCQFCLFCPFPPAAHPLITSSLGRQCNNHTKESGLFPFVLLFFEARQLRRAITPAARPSHVRLTACQGSQAPRHEGSVPPAPGDRGPALWKVGKAELGGLARGAALCSSALALTEHLSALTLSPPEKPSSQAGPLSSPQRWRQPPSSLQHMAWRLLGWFSLSSHKSRLPLSQPPFPVQLNSAIEPSEWFISQVSTKQGSLCAPGTSRTKRTKTLEGHL